MTNFGLALYNWRMGSGMPQVAAARSLGVSVATLGAWERGKTEPQKKKMQAVAELGKPVMPDGVKMARLLGYLEGLAAVPDYDLTLMLETPISIVREMMEGHYGC